jgi:hypothetical protein
VTGRVIVKDGPCAIAGRAAVEWDEEFGGFILIEVDGYGAITPVGYGILRRLDQGFNAAG